MHSAPCAESPFYPFHAPTPRLALHEPRRSHQAHPVHAPECPYGERAQAQQGFPAHPVHPPTHLDGTWTPKTWVLTRVQPRKSTWTAPKIRHRLDVQTPTPEHTKSRRHGHLKAWIATTTWPAPQASLGCLE